MAELDEKQKKFLRGLGHKLEPVARSGNPGLTPSLVKEVEAQLLAHELIKMKVATGDREERDALIGRMCAATKATLVQRVGNIALLYKRHPKKPKIELPK
ncbi:MAG TPA: ribosome assembly RNA-binding protein YhbY [Gammaproteobacteria bacterium]|nr:ribosome assembly RNA-binding protein YhbY [Gammaproteobacteria bacterium]